MTVFRQQPHAPGWEQALAIANGCPRCGAKTRQAAPCKAPAVAGHRRCRMHGGADGSGGPIGKRNGNYRTGAYAQELAADLRLFRALARLVRTSR